MVQVLGAKELIDKYYDLIKKKIMGSGTGTKNIIHSVAVYFRKEIQRYCCQKMKVPITKKPR
jgi:hypothetical protein